MTKNPALARLCEALMARIPASVTDYRKPKLAKGQRWTPKLTQRECDILWAALGHHAYYCKFGRHEDVGEDVPELTRLAAQIFNNRKVGGDLFDPYAHLDGNPKFREFIIGMDLHTLSEVVVKVMTDLWTRRRKYLGGDLGLAKGPLGPK